MTTGRDVSWNASWRCSKKSQSGWQVADFSIHSTTNACIYFFLSLLWVTLVLEPCIEVTRCSCVSGTVEPTRTPALHLYWSEMVQLCVRYSRACQDTCIAPVLKWDGAVVCQVQSSLPGHLHGHHWLVVACYLVKHGADLSTANCCGNTPMQYATDSVIADILRKCVTECVNWISVFSNDCFILLWTI